MGFFDSLFGRRDPGTYNSRGLRREQNGDLRGAIADFGKAIQLDPRFGAAYVNRGFALYAAGDFGPAISDLSRAIELDPIALAYHDRGLARTQIGEIEGAIADFNKAIELGGEDAAYFGRGLARLKEGDADAAVADFRTAVMRDRRLIDTLRTIYEGSDPEVQGRMTLLVESLGNLPLGPDELLHAKALEVGRALGLSLAQENRALGLFIWHIDLVGRKGRPPSTHAGTFSWCMKRVGNEIMLYDGIDLFALPDASPQFMEAVVSAGRELQENFKRMWLERVGPVTLRPASQEMVALSLRAAVEIAKAQGALGKP
jgi:tetratricopeptide (TPR) repeat protein